MKVSWFPELDWEMDADGYRLEEHQASKGARLLGTVKGGRRIVGNGGERLAVTFNHRKPVFIALANAGRITKQDEALAFVNKYGLPAASAQDNEISLDEFVDKVSSVRSAVDLMRKGRGAEIQIQLGEPASPKITLGPDHALIVKSNSFMGFVGLQLLYAVQKRTAVKLCRVCYGFMIPKSDKRETCSDACRQKAHRTPRRKIGH